MDRVDDGVLFCFFETVENIRTACGNLFGYSHLNFLILHIVDI